MTKRQQLLSVHSLFALAACGGGGGGADGGPVATAFQCMPQDAGASDGGPTDVPLAIVPLLLPLPDGGSAQVGVRFALNFGIGDSGPIEAFLDTGSAGIQLLQDAVPPEVVAALDSLGTTTVTEEFEGGIEATGVVAQASITLGNLTTPTPVPILLIQSLTCNAGFPCVDDPGPPADSVFEGYPAILGVGLRSLPTDPPVGSPIAELPGHPAFIVEAPAFGGDAGLLRINPSATEVAAYSILQLPALPALDETGDSPLSDCTPVWNDLAVPVCLDDQTTAQSTATQFCSDGALDTGSPFTLVEWQGYTGPTVLPPSSAVQVSVGPMGAPLAQFDVTVGATPQPGLDYFAFLASDLDENLINLGTTIFYRYDVYFDQAQGQIGLLSH